MAYAPSARMEYMIDSVWSSHMQPPHNSAGSKQSLQSDIAMQYMKMYARALSSLTVHISMTLLKDVEEDEQAPPEEAQLLVVEDPIVLTDAELIQIIKVSISVKPF